VRVVRDVRQRGVMVGVELRQPDGAPFPEVLRAGRRVSLAARRGGVIVRPLGDVVVLNPPLVMTPEEASELLAVLEEAITSVAVELDALHPTAQSTVPVPAGV